MNGTTTDHVNTLSALTITHTSEAGTLLEGSARGDGVAEIIKPYPYRFRGGRSIGCWYLPHSRDREPQRKTIAAVVSALREAGHTVTAEIDATPRDMAQAEAARAEHMDGRAGRLSERAEQHELADNAHHEAARRILDRIPPGQPILVDHYSAPGHRRALSRAQRHEERSIEHGVAAREAGHLAETANMHMTYRNNPQTVARRIETLAAECRKIQHMLDSTGHFAGIVRSGDADSTSLTERAAHLDSQLAYWQRVRDQQIADGFVVSHSRDTVKVGDQVRRSASWYTVVRVNQKIVSVATGHSWTDRVAYHDIREIRAAVPAAGEVSSS